MADARSQATAGDRPSENPATDIGKTGQGRGKKRNIFGLGKSKTEGSSKEASSGSATAPTPSLPKETSQLSSASRSAAVSPTQPEPTTAPTSPSRALSSSPRISSPARSQIFERDVQDSAALQPNSPAIPTHIQTENYIPPVLGDASEAITNHNLDPDAVEIVTQRSHQPAAVTVTGGSNAGGSQYDDQSTVDWTEELSSFANREPLAALDNASNYGSLDSADVRRLSFISFADVVQSEQGGAPVGSSSRESIHLAGLTSLPPASLNRSPSPIRSPVSSQGPGTSPPTSNPGSMKGVEMSPPRKPIGSPMSGSLNLGHASQSGGELSIETMSQALRRTGSRDLGNVRSIPTSPVDGPSQR